MSIFEDEEDDGLDFVEERNLAEAAPVCPMGGLEFEVRGKSGKMLFYKKGKRADGIVVEMDSLKELDKDGNVIGGKDHSFNSFATQDFTVSEMEESDYQGIDAYKTTFAAAINGGNFTVGIYLMLKPGNITNGDEVIEVKPGQFKFTVDVDGWNWCDGKKADTSDPRHCAKGQTAEVGEMLDFTLEIKGRNAPKTDGGEKPGKRPPKGANGKRKPAKIDLGDGASVELSSKVEVNGNWTDMPGADDATNPYPMVATQGPKTMYTFRFPKAAKIFYDPGVDMGVTAEQFEAAMAAEGGSTATTTAAGATTVVDDNTSAGDSTTAEDDEDDEETTTTKGSTDAGDADSAAMVSVFAALALLVQ